MSAAETHTPTPWAIDETGSDDIEIYPLRDGPPDFGRWSAICICQDQYDDAGTEVRANAEFIVRAVNSHAALAARVAELEAALKGQFCVLFLDGRNEWGAHTMASFPCSIDIQSERDLADQSEAILVAAEQMGFVVGEDHVWAEFTWINPQRDGEGRVELDGYWEFVGINERMTRLVLPNPSNVEAVSHD